MSLMVGEEIIVPSVFRSVACAVMRVGTRFVSGDVIVQRLDTMSLRPVHSRDCVRVEGNVYRPVRWHR